MQANTPVPVPQTETDHYHIQEQSLCLSVGRTKRQDSDKWSSLTQHSFHVGSTERNQVSFSNRFK